MVRTQFFLLDDLFNCIYCGIYPNCYGTLDKKKAEEAKRQQEQQKPVEKKAEKPAPKEEVKNQTIEQEVIVEENPWAGRSSLKDTRNATQKAMDEAQANGEIYVPPAVTPDATDTPNGQLTPGTNQNLTPDAAFNNGDAPPPAPAQQPAEQPVVNPPPAPPVAPPAASKAQKAAASPSKKSKK